jgi:hypothetical protein
VDTPVVHRRNGEILEEVNVEPVDSKLRRYKSNWLRYVTRMNSSRMPKNAELKIARMKTTWKTFEEPIRRGRNRSIKV